MSAAERGGRRRSLILVVVVALVVAGILTLLALRDSGQGSAAIDEVKRLTASGLQETERRIEAQGGTLRVSWSSTPAPSGGGHVVMARLVTEPSGDVGTASFGVTGDRIVAQDEFAQRLLEVPSAP